MKIFTKFFVFSITFLAIGGTYYSNGQRMKNNSSAVRQVVSSMAAPEVLRFKSSVTAGNTFISFRLLNPTTQVDFIGALVQLTCGENYKSNVLLSTEMMLDENKKRLSDMVIDQVVILQAALAPGKQQDITFIMVAQKSAKPSSCEKISMRGAW